MKKIVLALFVFFIANQVHAQIEVAKLTGKNSENYSVGFGAFLKFAQPVSDADAVSVEIGLKYFYEKGYAGTYGLAYLPLKLGYRYSLDRSGAGFYIEPQLGYNLYGVKSYQADGGLDVDEKFHGLIWAAGAGYLFNPGGRIQFDLSLHYESVIYNNGPVNNISFRLAHNFSFGKRE